MRIVLFLLVFYLWLPASSVFAQEAVWKERASAGFAARKQGRLRDAETHYLAALIEAEKLGERNWRLNATLINLAGVYVSEKRFEDAERLYQRALSLPGHEEDDGTINELGKIRIEQKKYDEAEVLIKKAMELGAKRSGPDHLNTAGGLSTLAWLYRKQERYAEAEPLYKRSLAIFEKALGNEHPQVAHILDEYAAVLRKMNRKAEAKELESRAKDIRAKSGSDPSYRVP
jgi:tetratricopeptide (TPR) repeat protein